MTDETTNLVLEHLKRIQSDLARVREEQRTQHAALMAVQQTQNAHSTLLSQALEDIATVRVRLDRIERRLELTEPAE